MINNMMKMINMIITVIMVFVIFMLATQYPRLLATDNAYNTVVTTSAFS